MKLTLIPHASKDLDMEHETVVFLKDQDTLTEQPTNIIIEHSHKYPCANRLIKVIKTLLLESDMEISISGFHFHLNGEKNTYRPTHVDHVVILYCIFDHGYR